MKNLVLISFTVLILFGCKTNQNTSSDVAAVSNPADRLGEAQEGYQYCDMEKGRENKYCIDVMNDFLNSPDTQNKNIYISCGGNPLIKTVDGRIHVWSDKKGGWKYVGGTLDEETAATVRKSPHFGKTCAVRFGGA